MEQNGKYAKGIASDKTLSYALSNLELFHDQDGNLHAIVKDGDKNSIVDIPGNGLERWIRRLFLRGRKTTLASSEIEKIVAYIEALSEDSTIPQRNYFTRVGQQKKILFYDLGTDSRQIIKVTKKSVEIVDNSELQILFRPSLPQILPELNANSDILLKQLKPYFRVSSEPDFLLLCVYICSCFIYQINHPILVVYGTQGSAKSTTIELVGKIIDPRRTHRATLSTDRKSMVSTIGSRYFLAYDNLRVLKQWQSDLLCCASTGGSEPMRILYTTSDVKETNLKSCIALNGISVIATEPDLLDRTILIELTRIPDDEYEPEESLYRRFHNTLPEILGAIFNTLSKALNLYDSTDSFPHTRMQDFAKYGYCIAEALGGYGDQFIQAYQENKKRSKQESRLPLVVECILSFMLYQSDWSGSMTLLYEHLSKIAKGKRGQSYDFPANPSALSREINQQKNQLKENNIIIINRHGNSRQISLQNVSLKETEDL